jgi:phospholipase C
MPPFCPYRLQTAFSPPSGPADINGDTVSDGEGGTSLIEDAQPYYDDCSTRDAASLTGKNVGDLLNAAG